MAIIKCGNCGRNISAGAPACPFCSYAPVTPWEQRHLIAWFSKSAYKENKKYIILVWAFALVASYPIFGHPATVLLLPAYPLGLAILLSKLFRVEDIEPAFTAGLVIGWVGYLILTVLCLYAQRRRLFYSLMATLSLLLLGNAVGCQTMVTGLLRNGIH